MKIFNVRETSKGYVADLIAYPRTIYPKLFILLLGICVNTFSSVYLWNSLIVTYPLQGPYTLLIVYILIMIVIVSIVNAMLYELYWWFQPQHCWRLYKNVDQIQPLLKEIYKLRDTDDAYFQNVENTLEALLNSGLEEYSDDAFKHLRQAKDFYSIHVLSEFELRYCLELDRKTFFNLDASMLMTLKDVSINEDSEFYDVFNQLTYLQRQKVFQKEAAQARKIQDSLIEKLT